MSISKKVFVLIILFLIIFPFAVNALNCWRTSDFVNSNWTSNFNQSPKNFYLETDPDIWWCSRCIAYHPYNYSDADWTVKLPKKGTYTFYKVNWRMEDIIPGTTFELKVDNSTIVSERSSSSGYLKDGKDFECNFTVNTTRDNEELDIYIENDYYVSHEGMRCNIGGFYSDSYIYFYYTYTPPPNNQPRISILNPTNEQKFNGMEMDFEPQIRVSDGDNDTLTCRYYIDSSDIPEDTKMVDNTSSSKMVTFGALNMTELSKGNHTLRFEVTDGKDTVEEIVNFRIINSPPQINIINPIGNTVFSENDVSVILRISVSDPNGDNLICRYYINSRITPEDTRQISNTSTAQSISFSAFDIANFSTGEHTLKFTVNDGNATVQDMVTIKVDKTPPSLGTITFTSTDKGITVTGSATDSLSGMHSSPYRYTVGTSVSSWTSSTSYTKNALTPNTLYKVEFEARDNTDHIAVKEQDIYTKAQVPQLSVNNATDTTLNVSVSDDNPGSTKYQIKVGSQYVNATGGLTSTSTWIGLTNKTITVKGLLPNMTYQVQVAAKNDVGIVTRWSNSISGTTLANPPDDITIVPTQTSIKLSWSSVPGVVGYDVEVDGAVKSVGTSTSYMHSELNPDTTHIYRIRVQNAGGIGKWSELMTQETLPYPPETPTNLRCIEDTQTQIKLAWDAPPRATHYELEANGEVIYSGTGTTFSHTGLTPEMEYQYRIRAKNKGGDSGWSELFTQSTLPNPPAKPSKLTTEIGIHQVIVTWAPVEKAEGYEIMVDEKLNPIGLKTMYIHEGLQPLSGHTYKVRATRAGDRVKGPWSETEDITTHPEIPDVPTNIMATAEQTAVTLTWYEVPHTESYDIEIDGTTVINVKDRRYIHKGLALDEQHSYRVRANNVSGQSDWSTPVKTFTLPEGGDGTMALTNVVAVVTNNFITLSWDAAAYDAEYDIEVDGKLKNNGKETIFHHTSLNPNEYHTYKIRVKNNQGVDRWCAVLSLSTLPNPPDAPADIQAFATDNRIELRWERVEGATGYDIEIDGKTVTGGADSVYIHEPLGPGTSHIYRVRAKNITGVTAWSPALVKSTTNPNYIVQCTTGQSFDLSLLANNVQDFTDLTFTVTYNPDEVEVVDLCAATPEKDMLSEGIIPGTGIRVKHTAGKITFTVDKNIVPGTSWSGEMTAVIFKAKITGQSTINFTVE